MKSHFQILSLMILLMDFTASHAQGISPTFSSEKRTQPVFGGTHFGRTLVHLDTRMRLHNRFGVSLQLPWKGFLWDLNVEYYEADGAWGARAFDYKSFIYIIQNVQYITAFALDLSVSKRMARYASVGLGISLDYFRIETIVNNKTFPFYIDQYDNFIFWGEETQNFRFLSPGLFLVSGLHYPLGRSLQVYLKQQTKATYIGKNYHAHPLNSWITFTFYGGIRMKI